MTKGWIGAVAILGLVAAGTAWAGTEGDVAITLHAKAHAQKALNTCAGGSAPEDPVSNGIPCSQFETNRPLATSTDIYLVAVRDDLADGISWISCGIRFDDPIAMFGWTRCADSNAPDGNWPFSGGGNLITWNDCQDTEVPPDGVHAVAGAFYVYAYDDGLFEVIPNPGGTQPGLRVADCSGNVVDPVPPHPATVGFGTDPGYNTCLEMGLVDCDRMIDFQGEDAVFLYGIPDTVEIPVRNAAGLGVNLSIACFVDGDPLPPLSKTVAGGEVLTVRVPLVCTGAPIGIECISEAVLPGSPDCVSADTSSITVSCLDPRPEILSVTDVTGDQGGWVWLRFARSSYDDASEAIPVTTYEIYRRAEVYSSSALRLLDQSGSFPPGTWNRVGFFGATQFDEYLFRASTEVDSSAAGPGTTAFVVLARSTDPDFFFISDPDSGYSVGNLEPTAPLTVLQNQPNPFRDRTQIALRTGEAGMVRVRVLDLAGREVARPYEAHAGAGEMDVVWDGRTAQGEPAPAGVYFYQVTTPGASVTRKLLVLR